LIISHKKREFGLTVSTEELVFQKPHANYHIKLEDIAGIVPFETKGKRTVTLTTERNAVREITKLPIGSGHYRFYVNAAVVHNRSGVFQMGPSEFVLPVLADLLHAITKHGGMNAVMTG
jgi:hypothetical protein